MRYSLDIGDRNGVWYVQNIAGCCSNQRKEKDFFLISPIYPFINTATARVLCSEKKLLNTRAAVRPISPSPKRHLRHQKNTKITNNPMAHPPSLRPHAPCRVSEITHIFRVYLEDPPLLLVAMRMLSNSSSSRDAHLHSKAHRTSQGNI